jgi:hypothetical protein
MIHPARFRKWSRTDSNVASAGAFTSTSPLGSTVIASRRRGEKLRLKSIASLP